MYISQVTLNNFRNYRQCQVNLLPGRNILTGENAQGKTNFLEALELLSTGKSSRSNTDTELVLLGQTNMQVELAVASLYSEHTMSVSLNASKTFKLNGIKQASHKGIANRLVVVSFKSQDLNMLRGGPKYRREWVDQLICKLRPAFHDVFSNYNKVVAQRNRLLKTLFDKGKVTVGDQDQLVAWDHNLATLAAKIIKERQSLLARLLPGAQEQQLKLSRDQEQLSYRYLFKATASQQDTELSEDRQDPGNPEPEPATFELQNTDEASLAQLLIKLMKERRFEEIRRRASIFGPHRDDIAFYLNNLDAVAFASQGQQRSLILALKLAELQCVQATLNEPPVLLLDDVLAELDSFRQSLLMSCVDDHMQTIITTTHVSGFDPRWLDGARLLTVADGKVSDNTGTSCI